LFGGSEEPWGLFGLEAVWVVMDGEFAFLYKKTRHQPGPGNLFFKVVERFQAVVASRVTKLVFDAK
jgi:hypothetical protein